MREQGFTPSIHWVDIVTPQNNDTRKLAHIARAGHKALGTIF